MKKLAIIIQQPPSSQLLAKETIEFTLMAAAFDLELTLIFKGQGIQLLIDHSSNQLTGMIKSLQLLDIKAIYVEELTIKKFAINPEQFILSYATINDIQLSKLLQRQEAVLTF